MCSGNDEGILRQHAWQKATHDEHCSTREFYTGQQVMARNFRPGPMWLPGIISEQLGPLTYQVEMDEDWSWKRHNDQLRSQGDSLQETLTYPNPAATAVDEPEFEEEMSLLNCYPLMISSP